MKKQKSYLFFTGTQPCKSCPYRKDAPLQMWDKYEFDKLLLQDKEMFGGMYKCHKNNGSCCKGWLINQDNRNHPNIALRIRMSREGITREYLDKLKCDVEMFETIEEMVEANYPNKNIENKIKP